MDFINSRVYFEIFFLIVGSLLTILNAFLIYRAYNSNKWNIVKGVIVKSEIEDLTFSDDSFHSYKLKIKYSYMVKGRTYISSRVYFGDKILFSFKKWFQGLVNKYHEGFQVDVYYNPSNPKLSVLLPGIKQELIIGVISGVVFLILGLILRYSQLPKQLF